MQANGQHPGSGDGDSASEDNVVRLPREWVGPRDELVPVAVDDGPPVDTLAIPPSTRNFWGEALSDDWTTAVQLAAPDARPSPHWWRRFTHARGSARRSLAPSAGITGAVVLMLVGLAISAGGRVGHSARAVHGTVALAPGPTVTVAGTGLVPAGTRARLHSRPSGVGIRHSSHRATTTRRAGHAAQRDAGGHAAPRSRTITVEQVRYTAPAATTTPSAAPTSPSSPAPPVTTPAAPPATAATRTPAGSNQPATGASGALGPGSSPDG